MNDKLLQSPLFDKIKSYLTNVKDDEKIILYVPYIKTKILEQLIEGVQNEISIITTWHTNDLVRGSSELELYSFCKENNISLYINDKIHLKVYSVNLESAIIGSGNISQRGLMGNGNFEAAVFLESLNSEDRLYLEKIRNDAIFVDDDVYQQYQHNYEKCKKDAPKQIEFKDPIIKSRDEYFLKSALPMTRNLDDLVEAYLNINSDLAPSKDSEITACIYHDLTNYSIKPGLSKKEFLEKLKTEFFSHPFILKIDEFINPEAYFGRIKEWIHDNCTDVPLPRRWELTENVQILYDWFEKLGDGKYVVDRPNHSQRITKISIEKFDEKPQNPILEFQIGKFYHHDDIWKPLGLGWSGGIRTSVKNKLVILFWNAPSEDIQKEKKDDYGRVNIYEDSFDEKTGLYRYIGEGKEGNQTLTRGNKSIVNAKQNGQTIHLFHQHERNGKHEYLGEVELIGKPEIQIHQDINEKDRDEFVFFLKPSEIQKINKNDIQSESKNSRLVLFSVAGEAAFEHYENTILKDVSTSYFETSEMKKFPNVRMWGAIDRQANQNRSKWSKLRKGDIILFYRDKKYVTKMILDGTEDNHKIAKKIWGEKIDHEIMNTKHSSGETWKLIMYCSPDNIEEIDIKFEELNKLLGYKENFMPTRTLDFTTVSEIRLQGLQNKYGSINNALNSII